VYNPDGKLSILHLILAVRETSAPYNEHCLPWAGTRHISVCTYFGSDLTPPQSIRLFNGDGTLPGFFRALRSALDEKQYDVIHVHAPHLGLLFLIGTLFSRRMVGRSTVITVHDSFQNYKSRNKLLFIPVFAAFQSVVCCSRASYDSFPDFFKRLAGDRLCYAQNGPDIARVDRIAAGIRRQVFQAGVFTSAAIGRMVDIKNHASLLQAFRASANASSRLVLIGDGPLRAQLEGRAREFGLADQVEFTGLIPRELVFQHLLNADLFVSTSRGEGLPVSVLEAMACGCPVLLSDIPPHREIAEGVDFIPLVDPDDAAGFAREMARFRAMPARERAAIGWKCRKLVEEHFSLAAMHARYGEIYARVMGAPVSSSMELAS
jgi:glycosyltransferase involved in cell wall biosynthesis